MLLYNGQLASATPMTLLGVHWQFFQHDTRVLMQSNAEAFSSLSAYPTGYNPQGSLVPPRKAGRMASFNFATVSLSSSASILGGKALEGSATFTIDTNTPAGELIAFGLGTATIQLSTNNPLLTASINGGGTASFTIDTNLPVLGAEASMVGTTTITITVADADILPANDASPLRTATASMTFSGTLVPYAIGNMTGTTEESGLTVTGITNSVWNAILANYPTSGTAGNALGLASSGGVDYNTLAAAILAAAQASPIHANTKKINDVTVTGQGTDGTPWGGSP